MVMALKVCRAGNSECRFSNGTSVLREPLRAGPCDVCCAEPEFCPECKCILCAGRRGSSDEWIQCLHLVGNVVCGHSAHLECALQCRMAGVLEDSGLDVEYWCRRCDAKMDLLPRAHLLMESVAVAPSQEAARRKADIVARLVQGTKRLPLQNKAAETGGEGCGSVQDDDDHNPAAAITIRPDEPAVMEMDESSAPNTDPDSAGPLMANGRSKALVVAENENESIDHSHALITSEQLFGQYQSEIQRALQQLKLAQEKEYAVARDRLTAQMEQVLEQYKALESGRYGASATPSSDAMISFVEKLQEQLGKLKEERARFDEMLQIGQGFGSVPRELLLSAFNWPPRTKF